MIRIIITFFSCTFMIFNLNLMANENENKLKIGLLAPFSGAHKSLGESLLLSTRLALDEIDDKKIIIIPRDSGSDNKDKLNLTFSQLIWSGLCN